MFFCSSICLYCPWAHILINVVIDLKGFYIIGLGFNEEITIDILSLCSQHGIKASVTLPTLSNTTFRVVLGLKTRVFEFSAFSCEDSSRMPIFSTLSTTNALHPFVSFGFFNELEGNFLQIRALLRQCTLSLSLIFRPKFPDAFWNSVDFHHFYVGWT